MFSIHNMCIMECHSETTNLYNLYVLIKKSKENTPSSYLSRGLGYQHDAEVGCGGPDNITNAVLRTEPASCP
jgi:hypothetical protein